jgi:recombination protein RecA
MYGEGISKYGDMLDLGSSLDIIKKSGSWFSYGDIRLGQGRENAKQYIKDHPSLAVEIENAARKHYGMKELEALSAPENFITVDMDAIDDDTDDDDVLDIELIDMDMDMEIGDEMFEPVYEGE